MDKSNKLEVYLGKNKLKHIKQIYRGSEKISPNISSYNFNNRNESQTNTHSKQFNTTKSIDLPKLIEQNNKMYAKLTKTMNFSNSSGYSNYLNRTDTRLEDSYFLK